MTGGTGVRTTSSLPRTPAPELDTEKSGNELRLDFDMVEQEKYTLHSLSEAYCEPEEMKKDMNEFCGFVSERIEHLNKALGLRHAIDASRAGGNIGNNI